MASPRDLNGYGYFHARLGWTGFGLRANIVEKYVLFSAMLHVAVALERNRADPVVHLVVTLRRKFLGSCGYVREPWPRAKMDSGRVSTYSSFARRILQYRALVMGPRVCFCIQQGRKPVLVFFPMALQVSSSKSGWWVHIVPAKHRRQPPDWVAQGVTTFEFSRTLLSMRKRMRPSSRGPFSAIGWYLLPGPAYCGCFCYDGYFSGVLGTLIPAVLP